MAASEATELLRQLVETFIEDMPMDNDAWTPAEGWMPRYTKSPAYLRYLGDFHVQPAVLEFMDWLIDTIDPDATVYDVGCVCGYTGFVLAMHGIDVAFHDFEGLGLEFIRWARQILMGNNGTEMKTTVIPYGVDITPCRDWAIALDVIEHTPNALGFIRWMKMLGDKVAFSFPAVHFCPPYMPVLDQWTDAEALRWIIHKRYDIIQSFIADNRTYHVFQ